VLVAGVLVCVGSWSGEWAVANPTGSHAGLSGRVVVRGAKGSIWREL